MNNIPPYFEKSNPIPIREINYTSDSSSPELGATNCEIILASSSPELGATDCEVILASSTSVSGSPSSQNSPIGYYVPPKKIVFHKSYSPYQSISPRINQSASPNSPSLHLVNDSQYNQHNQYNNQHNQQNNQYNQSSFRPYDAVQKAKGAGIIPYTVIGEKIYLLLQRINNPLKKKDGGWNDFGGKKNNKFESTAMTAGREFSEETSCLFYLKEQSDPVSSILYSKLIDNPTLTYDDDTIDKLKQTIKKSEIFFADRINTYVNPIHVSSKETYISYVVKVKYIPIEDIPRAEDIHIPYEERYIRSCKWFSLEEFMNLDENELHKRLQITKVKNRIQNFYERGLLD